MILILVFLAGGAIGWMRAARRGGDKADKAQYAAAHGIAFALLFYIVMLGLRLAGVM